MSGVTSWGREPRLGGTMRPRIFAGSSREAVRVCRAIQAELDEDFEVTVWDQGVFRLSYGALDSLLDTLDSSDAGVFILRPDDLTEKRGESSPTVRDNVIFELGLFIGRLGRDRTFMLTPNNATLSLPSDLVGLTTAHYDADRFAEGHGRAAVGPACTRIREAFDSIQLRIAPEPRSRARLDRAMRRLSKDLEYLLADRSTPADHAADLFEWPGCVSLRLGRTNARVEVGRIQDYHSADSRAVIALPANEYFDDECISDTNSSLGAFIQHHFKDDVAGLIRQVRTGLSGIPSQRVPRAERRIDESYGIGEAIFLSRLQPDYRLILVSATTERTGIGLRAEPHFLYAALEGVIETMNERRLNSLTMPVLGSGHGGMPLPVAILFNLLAVRSILAEDLGRHVREIRIVVFDGDAAEVSETTMRDIISHVAPA
jgi:O-acetyl-ADP-ribose deacetylase (regulator of RNase III)